MSSNQIALKNLVSMETLSNEEVMALIKRGAFFMPGEICFLCPFLRKEVSAVANRIMGITVKIGKDTTKLQTGFLYNSKCRKNKKLYFINVS